MKNEAVVQSQAVSLRNLENRIGQLTTTLSNRPLDSLSNNTENPRREGKKHCKVINSTSENDIYILVNVPKRSVEPISTQEETQK